MKSRWSDSGRNTRLYLIRIVDLVRKTGTEGGKEVILH